MICLANARHVSRETFQVCTPSLSQSSVSCNNQARRPFRRSHAPSGINRVLRLKGVTTVGDRGSTGRKVTRFIKTDGRDKIWFLQRYKSAIWRVSPNLVASIGSDKELKRALDAWQSLQDCGTSTNSHRRSLDTFRLPNRKSAKATPSIQLQVTTHSLDPLVDCTDPLCDVSRETSQLMVYGHPNFE
jgi:hypothetical protein